MKTQNRNVTFNLPDPLLREFKVYAAQRNESMTKLVAEAIQRLMNEKRRREKVTKRFIQRLRNARDWGTNGRIKWKREDLYERVR